MQSITRLRQVLRLQASIKPLTSLAKLTTTQPKMFGHPSTVHKQQHPFTTIHKQQHPSTTTHHQQQHPSSRLQPQLTHTNSNMLDTKLRFYNSTRQSKEEMAELVEKYKNLKYSLDKIQIRQYEHSQLEEKQNILQQYRQVLQISTQLHQADQANEQIYGKQIKKYGQKGLQASDFLIGWQSQQYFIIIVMMENFQRNLSLKNKYRDLIAKRTSQFQKHGSTDSLIYASYQMALYNYCLENKRFEQAKIFLQKFLPIYYQQLSKDDRASLQVFCSHKYSLAECYQQLKQYKRSLQILQQLIQLVQVKCPQKEKASQQLKIYYARQAVIYTALGDEDKQIEALQNCMKNSKESQYNVFLGLKMSKLAHQALKYKNIQPKKSLLKCEEFLGIQNFEVTKEHQSIIIYGIIVQHYYHLQRIQQMYHYHELFLDYLLKMPKKDVQAFLINENSIITLQLNLVILSFESPESSQFMAILQRWNNYFQNQQFKQFTLLLIQVKVLFAATAMSQGKKEKAKRVLTSVVSILRQKLLTKDNVHRQIYLKSYNMLNSLLQQQRYLQMLAFAYEMVGDLYLQTRIDYSHLFYAASLRIARVSMEKNVKYYEIVGKFMVVSQKLQKKQYFQQALQVWEQASEQIKGQIKLLII